MAAGAQPLELIHYNQSTGKFEVGAAALSVLRKVRGLRPCSRAARHVRCYVSALRGLVASAGVRRQNPFSFQAPPRPRALLGVAGQPYPALACAQRAVLRAVLVGPVRMGPLPLAYWFK